MTFTPSPTLQMCTMATVQICTLPQCRFAPYHSADLHHTESTIETYLRDNNKESKLDLSDKLLKPDLNLIKVQEKKGEEIPDLNRRSAPL